MNIGSGSMLACYAFPTHIELCQKLIEMDEEERRYFSTEEQYFFEKREKRDWMGNMNTISGFVLGLNIGRIKPNNPPFLIGCAVACSLLLNMGSRYLSNQADQFIRAEINRNRLIRLGDKINALSKLVLEDSSNSAQYSQARGFFSNTVKRAEQYQLDILDEKFANN